MLPERTCITCNEEALMFCRMCSTHQCTEHLCLHLNVAWEQNSWTKRHEREYENQRSKSNNAGETIYGDEVELADVADEPETARVLSSTPKPLCAYSEAQLRGQYNFYTSQARRIRIELERRTIPTEGVLECGRKQSKTLQRRDVSQFRRKSPLGKSATSSYELLLSKLRSGSISLEYIQSKLDAS
jgi:hypothetical protein